MDKAVLGHCRLGFFRLGVRNDQWEIILKKYGDYDSTTQTYRLPVTRRKLQLDNPADSVTGWFTKTFIESDEDMLIYDRTTQTMALMVGGYVVLDAKGISADYFHEGDEVIHNGLFYEVKTVSPHYVGSDFYFYTYDLKLLPFRDTYNAVEYTSETLQDARYRTKDYLDTYLDEDYLGKFLVCYGEPDYPLTRVFKEKGINVVFSLDEPQSEALLQGNHYAYGYDEAVPVLVQTIDKIGLSGTQLKANAELHLREVLRNNPLGSVRSMRSGRPADKTLGSSKIYGTQLTINYTRSAS